MTIAFSAPFVAGIVAAIAVGYIMICALADMAGESKMTMIGLVAGLQFTAFAIAYAIGSMMEL
jgi:hypothetical protein